MSDFRDKNGMHHFKRGYAEVDLRDHVDLCYRQFLSEVTGNARDLHRQLYASGGPTCSGGRFTVKCVAEGVRRYGYSGR